jgi:erythromycin esterase
VGLAPDEVTPLAPPDPTWFEARLSVVPRRSFLVDLRPDRRVPGAVRRWLDAPATTRGLPDGGPSAYTDGGSLGQWFDALVHTKSVSPQQGL